MDHLVHLAGWSSRLKGGAGTERGGGLTLNILVVDPMARYLKSVHVPNNLSFRFIGWGHRSLIFAVTRCPMD